MFRNLKAKRLPLPSKDMVLSVLSGLLLSAAFPPHARGDLVFVALVPLLLAVRVSSPRRAAHLGFVSGLVFWLIDVAWLWSLKDNGGPVALVGLGHIALSLWLALFRCFSPWRTRRHGVLRKGVRATSSPYYSPS